LPYHRWFNEAALDEGYTLNQLRDHAKENNWRSPENPDRLLYPPKDGYDGTPNSIDVEPGQITLDRYSRKPVDDDTGNFFADEGASFGDRALPGTAADYQYKTKYEIIKTLPMLSGPATPWFDQPGGGMQFQVDVSRLPADIQQQVEESNLIQVLIRTGYLKEGG